MPIITRHIVCLIAPLAVRMLNSRKGEKLDLDVERKDRTPEEMAAEASVLRELLAASAV